MRLSLLFSLLTLAALAAAQSLQAKEIVYDAELGLLAEQHAERWAEQDAVIAARLAELEARFGKRPNIIHIMWDDHSLGEVGIPEMNKVLGYDTPHINALAREGISLFPHVHRALLHAHPGTAALTGRLAVRSRHVQGGLPGRRHGPAQR